MIKLSIIIPVYNSEKYLKACLESIFAQDLPLSDFEVILINDGSRDDSKNIMLYFQRQYSNLILIDQENQGVSAARNAGLAIAKGAYITFIDSDDFISKNALPSILSYIEENDLDILYASIETVDECGEHLSFFPETGCENKIVNGIMHPRRTYPPTFYKKEIIGDLRFDERISIGEDTLFNCMAQSKAQRVSYFSRPYYKHTRRPNSLSTSPNYLQKTGDMYIAIDSLMKFRKHYTPLTAEAEKYFNQVIKIFLARVIQWSITPTLDRKYYYNFQRFIQERKLHHLRDELVKDFPLINKIFLLYYLYHKIYFAKGIIMRKLSKFTSKNAT